MELNMNNENVGNIWNNTGQKSKAKKVSTTRLRQLGLIQNGLSIVETLKELIPSYK